MDKFIIEAPIPGEYDEVLVVKVDGEAAHLLSKLAYESGASKKKIVSDMIKFCYPRTEIHRVTIDISDKR